MTREEIIGIRNLLQEQLKKLYHLSLDLHKQQESIENIIRILDIVILEED